MIPLAMTIFGSVLETAAFPLADGGDVLGIIVVIVFLLISFLSRLPQMLNEKNAQQKKPANGRPPLQRPAGGAAQQPKAQQAPVQRQAGLQKPPQRRPLGDLAKQPAVAISAAIPAALPAERSVGPSGQGLPSVLDQRLTQHVQAAFDHGVGAMAENEADHVATLHDHMIGNLPDQQQVYEADELRAYAGSADHETADSAIAQELLALLKTRTGVRNAILLGEILRRPEDQWAI